jgi:hypothetical protein
MQGCILLRKELKDRTESGKKQELYEEVLDDGKDADTGETDNLV